MKKSQLHKIIKEEIQQLLKEEREYSHQGIDFVVNRDVDGYYVTQKGKDWHDIIEKPHDENFETEEEAIKDAYFQIDSFKKGEFNI